MFCIHREVALKVGAAVSLEALSSEIASDSEADSRKSLRGGLGRASKLIDIEAHLRQLQYDPFNGVAG